MTQTRIWNYIIFIIIIQHTIAEECNGHGTLEEGTCVCEDGWVGSKYREYPDAYCSEDMGINTWPQKFNSISLQECQDKCDNEVKCDVFTYGSSQREQWCKLFKTS